MEISFNKVEKWGLGLPVQPVRRGGDSMYLRKLGIIVVSGEAVRLLASVTE